MVGSGKNAARFDDWASTFDARLRDGTRARFPFLGYDDVLTNIAGIVLDAGARRGLDLGVGTGSLLDIISRRASEVELWGIDFSAEMLKRARRKLPQARLIEADIERLSAVDLPRYDAVVSSYVLHELTDERKASLVEHLLKDRLGPGGSLVVGDVAFGSSREREQARRTFASSWDPSEHYFAAEEFLRAMDGKGIKGGYRQISACAGIFVLKRGT